MLTYFRGWRRKLGVVTLMMTCVFAAGWARSQQVHDLIQFPIDGQAVDSLISHRSCLNWQRQTTANSRGHQSSLYWGSSLISDNDDDELFLDGPFLEWRWRFLGFGVREFSPPGLDFKVLLIPYWSIAIPLSLLSAYLLLSKPRKLPRLTKCDLANEIGA